MTAPQTSRSELKPGLGVIVVIVCAAVVISTLYAAPMAAASGAWFMLGFEVLVAVGAVFGILAGLRRFGQSAPLALVCVAGTILAGSFLGALGLDRSFLGVIGRVVVTVTVPGVKLPVDVLLAGRLVSVAVLAALAGWVLLARAPARTLPRLATGVGLGAAFVLLIGAAWWQRSTILGLNGLVRALIVVIGFLLLTGLFASSTHLLIGAFQTPRGESDRQPR